MGKFEKDMVRFIRIHKQCDKARLIQNINNVLQEKGIKRRNKCIWIAEITGVPVGSVNTWFTTAKCRDNTAGCHVSAGVGIESTGMEIP